MKLTQLITDKIAEECIEANNDPSEMNDYTRADYARGIAEELATDWAIENNIDLDDDALELIHSNFCDAVSKYIDWDAICQEYDESLERGREWAEVLLTGRGA